MVIIVMGSTNTEKLAIGASLAEALSCHHYNGDDFHPQSNLDKLTKGKTLAEADMAPWLASIRNLIENYIELNRRAVITCDPLNQSYRDLLLAGLEGVIFVYLRQGADTGTSRKRWRKSQALDPDTSSQNSERPKLEESGIIFDADESTEHIVEQILHLLKFPDTELT